MMFWISWTLALIALVTIPISIVVTSLIAKRSQKLFIQQWRNTGELNGIVEETFTGHGLVKVFGRQKETEQEFKEKNGELYEAVVRGPVHQRHHHAGHDVRREPQLRRSSPSSAASG